MVADVFFEPLPVPLHMRGLKPVHLNSEEMIDVIHGQSGNSHLDECSDCRRQLEEWRQLLSTLNRTHLQDAPAALLARAYGIMEPRPKLTEVLASMIFDSFTQP